MLPGNSLYGTLAAIDICHNILMIYDDVMLQSQHFVPIPYPP